MSYPHRRSMVTQIATRVRVLLMLLAFRLLVGSVVVVYCPYSILSSHPGRATLQIDLPTVLGACCVAVGLGFYLRSAWDFAFTGGSFEPGHLLVRGTYRVVRNPMYFGLVLVLLGESLALRSCVLAGYG